MSRYTNIAIPEDLANKIDEIIKDSNLGYRTKAEFVKEAVRLSLRQIPKYDRRISERNEIKIQKTNMTENLIV